MQYNITLKIVFYCLGPTSKKKFDVLDNKKILSRYERGFFL